MNKRMNHLSRRSMLLATSAALTSAAPASQQTGMKVGVATYSLRKFTRPQAIAILKELGVQNLSVKEFHLPYKDSATDLQAGRAEFDAAGLAIGSGGVVVTHKEDESALRRYFEYGRTCRMPMLIMMPAAKQLPTIEKLASEYQIQVAVHNHGPEDKNFPTPESVYEAIRPLDRRIGLCIDVGHSARAGVDVVQAIRKYKDRLVDVHLKDLRDLKGHTDCEIGKGVLPVAEILKALKAARYGGSINLEYEADAENPTAGLRASLAYVHGILAGLSS